MGEVEIVRSVNSVERLKAAILGEPVDRVPTMPLIKQFCTRQLGWKYGDYNRDHRVLVEAQLRMQERWDFDCFNTLGYPYREAGDCGLPLLWSEDSGPKAQGILVRERSDIERIRWPGPWDGPLMSDRLRAIELFRERRPGIAVLGWVEGCFAQAITFLGMEGAMMGIVLSPNLLREVMDFILPHEIAYARAQCEAGADVMGVGDSAASLIGRDHYVEYILPYETELIGAIRAMGVVTKLHICGDITRLLADVATAGADMVDIDWMVELTGARRVLGPKVCLCGNFDPVVIMLQSSAEEVRQSCHRCIREAGTPFVLSPGCEVPPDTPAENFTALCAPYKPAAGY